MSEFEAERERRRFAVRVSLLFAAIAAIIGTSMPYLPVSYTHLTLPTN